MSDMTMAKTTKQDMVIGEITPSQFKASIIKHLNSTFGTDENKASNRSWWNATAAAVNEHVHARLSKTQKNYFEHDTRAVHYLSLEFLMGRLTGNNLHNLGLFETAKQALAELDIEIDTLVDEEEDMALGNVA